MDKDCEQCKETINAIRDRMDTFENNQKELSETVIRNDEKYKTIINLFTDVKKTAESTDRKVNELIVKLAVNDHKTNKNSNVLESLSVGKIVTIIVGALPIASVMKGA